MAQWGREKSEARVHADDMTPLQRWIQGRMASCTLAQIAAELKVSIKSVKAYRSGARRPGADNLLHIAEVTGLKLAELRKESATCL